MTTFETGDDVIYNTLRAMVLWRIESAVMIRFEDGSTMIVPAKDLKLVEEQAR